MESPPMPSARIAQVAAAQGRLEAVIAGLDDATAAGPSTLPGWTVGHVLTHVARNADSHRRRAEAARHGEIVDQYPGGPAGRAAEIEEGAGRDARTLVADVAASARAMAAAWAAVPTERWGTVSYDASGTERALVGLPVRRWIEVEIHTLDLGLGVTHRDLSDDFVDYFRSRLRSTIPQRLAPGAELPVPARLDALDARDEIAWQFGRLVLPDLPVLGTW